MATTIGYKRGGGHAYVDTTHSTPTGRASGSAGHDGAVVVSTAGARRTPEQTGRVEYDRTGTTGGQDYAGAVLCVTACNRNRPGLQSARFWDRIKCIYRPVQDHIICI